MMLTEQEAKTKTCPKTFGVAEIRGPDWNGVREPGPWPCMASGCMAWRWGPDKQQQYVKKGEPPPHGDGWTQVNPKHAELQSWERKVEQGFCGLAGEP